MSHVFYLVMVNYGCDDVPVQMFTDDREAAVDFAEQLEEAPQTILESLNLDIGLNPACSSIIHIVDGVPVKREVVKELD